MTKKILVIDDDILVSKSGIAQCGETSKYKLYTDLKNALKHTPLAEVYDFSYLGRQYLDCDLENLLHNNGDYYAVIIDKNLVNMNYYVDNYLLLGQSYKSYITELLSAVCEAKSTKNAKFISITGNFAEAVNGTFLEVCNKLMVKYEKLLFDVTNNLIDIDNRKDAIEALKNAILSVKSSKVKASAKNVKKVDKQVKEKTGATNNYYAPVTQIATSGGDINTPGANFGAGINQNHDFSGQAVGGCAVSNSTIHQYFDELRKKIGEKYSANDFKLQLEVHISGKPYIPAGEYTVAMKRVCKLERPLVEKPGYVSVGSGFVFEYDSKYYVLTARHVVHDCDFNINDKNYLSDYEERYKNNLKQLKAIFHFDFEDEYKNIEQYEVLVNNSFILFGKTLEADYAVLEIIPNEKILEFKGQILKTGVVHEQEHVLIIHHPNGEYKQNSIPDLVSEIKNGLMKYVVNTDGGSSGAPVFNAEMELVAVHDAGANNKAYNVGYILKDQDIKNLNDYILQRRN